MGSYTKKKGISLLFVLIIIFLMVSLFLYIELAPVHKEGVVPGEKVLLSVLTVKDGEANQLDINGNNRIVPVKKKIKYPFYYKGNLELKQKIVYLNCPYKVESKDGAIEAPGYELLFSPKTSKQYSLYAVPNWAAKYKTLFGEKFYFFEKENLTISYEERDLPRKDEKSPR